MPPATLTDAFGLAVRQLRDEQGLSQEELGQLTKLHRNHIGQLERAEMSPTLKTIQTIAKALNTSASELIARAERIAS